MSINEVTESSSQETPLVQPIYYNETLVHRDCLQSSTIKASKIQCNVIPSNVIQLQEGKYIPIYDVTDKDAEDFYQVEKEKELLPDANGGDVLCHYMEICNSGEHEIPQGVKITKVITPQRSNGSLVDIGLPCYMAIYGIPSTVQGKQPSAIKSYNDAVFIAKSSNIRYQQANGDDLVWYFNNNDNNDFSFQEIIETENQDGTVSRTVRPWKAFVLSLVSVPYEYDPQTGSYVYDEGGNLQPVDFYTAYGKKYKVEEDGTETLVPYTENNEGVTYVMKPIEMGDIAFGTGLQLPVMQYKPFVVDNVLTKRSVNHGTKAISNNSDGCKLYQTGKTPGQSGDLVSYTADYTIYYTQQQTQPRIVAHKDNSQVHVTPYQKEIFTELPNQFEQHKIETYNQISSFKNEVTESIQQFQELLAGQSQHTFVRNTKALSEDRAVDHERVHAWDMKCADYVGEYLTKITLYRKQPAQWDSGTNTFRGDENACWLFIDALSEDGTLLNTFFSINKDCQYDDKIDSTWEFQPIRIRPQYYKFRFRGTTATDADGNPIAEYPTAERTKVFYMMTVQQSQLNWGELDQIAIGQNVTSNDKTCYFQFTTIIKSHNIQGHIQDTYIHLNDKTYDKIDNSVLLFENLKNQIHSGYQNISTKNRDDLTPNQADTQYFQLSGDYIKGYNKICKIIIPFDYQPNSLSGYLVVQFYDQADTLINNKVYYSDNRYSYNSSIREMQFYFSNTLIPSNVHYIKMCLVSTQGLEPNSSNMLGFRTRPMNINGAYDWNDQINKSSNGSVINNWTVYCDFVLSKQHFDIESVLYKFFIGR